MAQIIADVKDGNVRTLTVHCDDGKDRSYTVGLDWDDADVKSTVADCVARDTAPVVIGTLVGETL